MFFVEDKDLYEVRLSVPLNRLDPLAGLLVEAIRTHNTRMNVALQHGCEQEAFDESVMAGTALELLEAIGGADRRRTVQEQGVEDHLQE